MDVEQIEKYLPRVGIAMLAATVFVGCVLLADFWLIVGLFLILAVTAGIIWASLRYDERHVDPILLDDEDIL